MTENAEKPVAEFHTACSGTLTKFRYKEDDYFVLCIAGFILVLDSRYNTINDPGLSEDGERFLDEVILDAWTELVAMIHEAPENE